MIDAKLELLDEQIKELNNKRIARIMEIQDPQRAAVKAKYEQVAQLLSELEEMGESITNEHGRDMYIEGTFFVINPDYTVEEV